MNQEPKSQTSSLPELVLLNDFGRLRSGWRFLVFFVPFFFLFISLGEMAGSILVKLPIGYGDNSLLARMLSSFIGLFLAIFLGWLCGRIFEDLPFRALGVWFTKFWFKDLFWGIIIGGLSIALAVLIGVIFGNLTFTFNEKAGSTAILITLFTSFLIFTVGAAFEEVLMRGYIFQTFVRANLIGLAIILTSFLFASGHLGNPNSSILPFVNTFLAGIWLGVAYLKTRTLWLATGIHFAWNWVQGSIFGIEVSGLTDLAQTPLLNEIDTKTNFVTGGNYGLEGGIACTIALIISTFAIWYFPFLKPTEEMLELTSEEVKVKVKSKK